MVCIDNIDMFVYSQRKSYLDMLIHTDDDQRFFVCLSTQYICFILPAQINDDDDDEKTIKTFSSPIGFIDNNNNNNNNKKH